MESKSFCFFFLAHMEPLKLKVWFRWLFPFQRGEFSGSMLVFGGVYSPGNEKTYPTESRNAAKSSTQVGASEGDIFHRYAFR